MKKTRLKVIFCYCCKVCSNKNIDKYSVDDKGTFFCGFCDSKHHSCETHRLSTVFFGLQLTTVPIFFSRQRHFNCNNQPELLHICSTCIAIFDNERKLFWLVSRLIHIGILIAIVYNLCDILIKAIESNAIFSPLSCNI